MIQTLNEPGIDTQDHVVRAAVLICRSMNNSHVVGTTYIIRMQDFVKIGFTKSDTARARIATLQCACPIPFEVVAQIRGGKELEQCLHDLFRSLNVRDEWFRYEGSLVEFVSQLADLNIHDGQ